LGQFDAEVEGEQAGDQGSAAEAWRSMPWTTLLK
jgi:hypothetical protein